MQPEDVLHRVNNQLEIIASAAHLLQLRHPDSKIEEQCNQIRSAVFNMAATLKTHFDPHFALTTANEDGDDLPRLLHRSRLPKTTGGLKID